jgi:hypothetical protein
MEDILSDPLYNRVEGAGGVVLYVKQCEDGRILVAIPQDGDRNQLNEEQT